MSHPPLSATPAAVITAIEMVAAGHTHEQVGKVLGCSPRTVRRILAPPEVKQALADLRLVLRAKTLQGVQVIAPALHVWLKEVIEGKVDARDADMLSRALLNLEKVAASASGENKPTFQPGQQVQVVVHPDWVKSKPAQATVTSVTSTPTLPTAAEFEAIEGKPPAIPKELLPAPKPHVIPKEW